MSFGVAVCLHLNRRGGVLSRVRTCCQDREGTDFLGGRPTYVVLRIFGMRARLPLLIYARKGRFKRSIAASDERPQ